MRTLEIVHYLITSHTASTQNPSLKFAFSSSAFLPVLWSIHLPLQIRFEGFLQQTKDYPKTILEDPKTN